MDTKKMALIFFGLSILCGKTTFAMKKKEVEQEKKTYDYNVWFRDSGGTTFNEKITNGYSIVVFYEDIKFHRTLIKTIKAILTTDLLERIFKHRLQLMTVPCEPINKELQKKFGIWSTPAYFIVKDGKIIAEESGSSGKEDLTGWLKKHINN